MILQDIKYHKRSSISEQVGSALYYVYLCPIHVGQTWTYSAVHTAPASFMGHTPSHTYSMSLLCYTWSVNIIY